MRLTNSDREAFVHAVMDDVPKIDYSEMYRKRMQQWCIDRLPTEAKALHKTRPDLLHTESRMCVRSQYVTCVGREHPNSDPKLVAELQALVAAWEGQDKAREALRSKLTSTIAGCNTLKQALEVLPEFEKYLPKERDGKIIRSMPVIANLVADLTAAGWPKDKPLKAA